MFSAGFSAGFPGSCATSNCHERSSLDPWKQDGSTPLHGAGRVPEDSFSSSPEFLWSEYPEAAEAARQAADAVHEIQPQGERRQVSAAR